MKISVIHCHKYQINLSSFSPSVKIKKKKKKGKTWITKNVFCASRQDRRLRGLFPIASRRKLCKHWATVSQKVMYEGKTIESALARRMKVWIVASKFENVSEHVHEEIWYTHDITLYYFCTLRAESVWYYCIRVWMVAIILDLSVTFWKLSNKLTL